MVGFRKARHGFARQAEVDPRDLALWEMCFRVNFQQGNESPVECVAVAEKEDSGTVWNDIVCRERGSKGYEHCQEYVAHGL